MKKGAKPPFSLSLMTLRGSEQDAAVVHEERGEYQAQDRRQLDQDVQGRT